jgi:hypothetical protein
MRFFEAVYKRIGRDRRFASRAAFDGGVQNAFVVGRPPSNFAVAPSARRGPTFPVGQSEAVRGQLKKVKGKK